MAIIIGYVLPFLIILSVVVFVHEYGHYWVARKNGVRVEVFSIGFGRELFGFNDKHGTRWKFSLIPLGGYVKMLGDADEASARPDAATAGEPESFPAKSVWQRMAIVAAGRLEPALRAQRPAVHPGRGRRGDPREPGCRSRTHARGSHRRGRR